MGRNWNHVGIFLGQLEVEAVDKECIGGAVGHPDEEQLGTSMAGKVDNTEGAGTVAGHSEGVPRQYNGLAKQGWKMSFISVAIALLTWCHC